jgi:hypothetical protein
MSLLESTRGAQHRAALDQLLPVECWCRATIVRVAPAVVRACRTESCGAAACQEVS